MQAGDKIIANMDLGDATVSLVAPRPARDFHQTYAGTRHLLAMYGTPALRARGRYLGVGRSEFSPIGSVFFRPAGLRLESMGRASGVDGLHCQFSDDRLSRSGFLTSDWTDRQLEAALNVHTPYLFSYYTRLISEITNPGFASAVIIDSLLTIILTDLARHMSGPASSEGMVELREHNFRMIIERICDVWDTMPKVGDLAEMAGVGERHLLRLFRQRKGTSLAAFIRATRLEKARYLLGHTDTPLKQIAFRLGFASHSTFATAFKHETGVTPAAFRRQERPIRVAPIRKVAEKDFE